MRITYLHQYFNTPSMSGGTRSYEMARRLVAMGHEVNMVTSLREPDGRKDWFTTDEAGIQVHWLPVPYSNHMGYNQRIASFFKFALGAARKAASLPADVVFATSTPLTIALPGAYTARRQKVPMVFEVRDLWPELPIAMGALRNPVARMFARRLEKFSYRNSKHVVALSPGMRDGVINAGYPIDNVSVIPNSADLELFGSGQTVAGSFRQSYPQLGTNTPLVVYTGTMGAINGVDYLPRIAGAALQAGFSLQFAVVGQGGQENRVREEGLRRGVLGKNFHMFPAVSKTDMPTVLRDADVALSLFIDLGAMWANSANKFFDALASGTPIAINYGGWQKDLIEQTGAGLVIPPNDPVAAAQALAKFTSDAGRLTAAGKAARRLAEDQFDRDILAQQLEGVLVDVAAKGV